MRSVALPLIFSAQLLLSIDNKLLKPKEKKTGHPLLSDDSSRLPYPQGQDSPKTSYRYHRKPLGSQYFKAYFR